MFQVRSNWGENGSKLQVQTEHVSLDWLNIMLD